MWQLSFDNVDVEIVITISNVMYGTSSGEMTVNARYVSLSMQPVWREPLILYRLSTLMTRWLHGIGDYNDAAVIYSPKYVMCHIMTEEYKYEK